MTDSTVTPTSSRRQRGVAFLTGATVLATSVLTLGVVAAPAAAAVPTAAPTVVSPVPAAGPSAPQAVPRPTRALSFQRGVGARPSAIEHAFAARDVRAAPRPDADAAASSWGGSDGDQVTIVPGIVARRVRTSGDGTGRVVLDGPGDLRIEADYVITGPDRWVITTTGGSGRLGGRRVRDADVSGRLRRTKAGDVRSSVVVASPNHEEIVPEWDQTVTTRVRYQDRSLIGAVRLVAERGGNRIALDGLVAGNSSYRLEGEGRIEFGRGSMNLTGRYTSGSGGRGTWRIGGNGSGTALADGTTVLSSVIDMTQVRPGVTGTVTIDHELKPAISVALDLWFVDDRNWELSNPRVLSASWTPSVLPTSSINMARVAGRIASRDGAVSHEVSAPAAIAVDQIAARGTWRLTGSGTWSLDITEASGVIHDSSLGLNATGGSGVLTLGRSGLSGSVGIAGAGNLISNFPGGFTQVATLNVDLSSSSPDSPATISRRLSHTLSKGRSSIVFSSDLVPGRPVVLTAAGDLAIGKGRIPVSGTYEGVGHDSGSGARTTPYWDLTANVQAAANGKVPLSSGASLVTGSLGVSSTSMAAQSAQLRSASANDLGSAATTPPDFPPGFVGDVEFTLSDNDPFTKTAHVEYQDENNWLITATVVDGPAWTPDALPGLTIQRNDISGEAYSVNGVVTWNITIPAVTWESASTGIVLTTPMSLSNECPLPANCPGVEGIYVGFVGGTLQFPDGIPAMTTNGAFLADASWLRMDAELDAYGWGPVTLTGITLSIWLGERSDEPVPDLGMPDLSSTNGGLNVQFCGGFEVVIPDIDTVGSDGCVAWSKAGVVIGQLALGGNVDSEPSNGVDLGPSTLNGFAWTDLPSLPTIDLDGIKVALEKNLNTITADLSMPGPLMQALGLPAVTTVIPATGWYSDGDFSLDAEVPINMTNNGFTLESATVHIGKSGSQFTLELGANAKVRAKGNQYPVSAFIGVEVGKEANGIVVRLSAKGAVSAQPDGTFDEPQLLPEGNFEPADDAVIDGTFDSRSKSTLAHGDFENADTPVNGVPNSDFETGTGGDIFPQGDFEDGAYGGTFANGDFEDTNMLLNGDFETGDLTSWTTTAKWTSAIASGTAPTEDEGSSIVTLGNTSGVASSTTYGFTQYVTVNPTLANAVYTLSLWARSPDTTTGAIEARLIQDQNATGCSGQTAITSQQTVTVDSNWKLITVTATGVSCRLRLGAALTVTTAGDSVQIDAVSLTVARGTAASAPVVVNTERAAVSSSAVTQKVVLDPTAAHAGNQYLSARSTASNWALTWNWNDAPVQTSIYTLSAWVKAPGTSVAGKLIIGTVGGTYEEVKMPFTATTTWQKVTVTMRMNNASHTDMLMKIGEVTTTNADLLIDDMILQQVDWQLSPGSLATGNVGVLSEAVIVDEAGAQEGINYLEIVNKNSTSVGGGSGVGVYQDIAGAPKVGTIYTLTAWFRSPNSATANLWIRGIGGTSSGNSVQAAIGTTWVQKTVTWTVAYNNHTSVRLELDNQTLNTVLYVDDVSLTATPYPIAQKTPTIWEPAVTFDTMPQISRSSDVTLDTTVGDTEGTLRSDGYQSQWYFAPGSVGDVTGDFDVSIDVFMPTSSGRDIANFAFWMTDTTGTPDGYMYRLQNSSTDSGFFTVSNNSHIGLAYANNPILQNVWYRLRLTAVGSSVTAKLTRLDTNAVVVTQTVTVPAGNRSGVFGQKSDGSQTTAGHRWDNFTNYSLTSTVFEDPSAAHTGRGFLQMQTTRAPATISRATSTVAAAGSTYVGSAWVKSPTGTAVSGTLTVSTDGTFETAKQTFTANATWQQVQVNLPVNKAGPTGLRIAVTTSTPNVALNIDDVSVLLIGLSQPDPWSTITSGTGTASAVVWSDGTVAHGGSKYLEAKFSGVAGSVINDSDATVSPGDQYTMSAWVRAASGTVAGKMILSFRGGTTAESRQVSFTATSSWQQLVVTLPAALAGNTVVRAEFSVSTLGVGLQIDDVSVDKLANWFVNTTGASTTTEQVITDAQSAYNGSSYAQVRTSAAGGGISGSVATTIRAGAEYQMSAFVRSTTGTPVSGRLTVYGSGTTKESAFVPFTATADWVDVSVTFTATTANTTLIGEITLDAAGSLDVDSIDLKPTIISLDRPWLTTAGAGGTISAVVYNDPTVAHEGDGYLLTSKTGGADSSVYHDIAVTPTVGSTYSATAWVKSSTGSPVSGQLVLTTKGGATQDVKSAPFTATGDWTPVTLLLPIAYANHTGMTVSIVLQTADVPLLVDDVLVQDARWTTFGASVFQEQINDGENAQSGGGFLKVTKTAAGDAGVQLAVSGSVAAATQQTMSAWVRSAGGEPVTGRLRLSALGGTQSDVVTSPVFTATSAWQKVSVTLDVVTAGHTSMQAQVFVDSVGVPLELDTVSIGQEPIGEPDGITTPLPHPERGYAYLWDDAFGIPGVHLWAFTAQVEYVNGSPGLGVGATIYVDPTRMPLVMKGTTWLKGDLFANISAAQPCFSFGFDATGTDTRVEVQGGVFSTQKFEISVAPRGCTVGEYSLEKGAALSFETSLGDASFRLDLAIGRDDNNLPTFYADVELRDLKLAGTKYEVLQLTVDVSAASQRVYFLGDFLMPMGRFRGSYDLTVSASKMLMTGSVLVTDWQMVGGSFDVDEFSYTVSMSVDFGPGGCGGYTQATSGKMSMGKKKYAFDGSIQIDCGALKAMSIRFAYSKSSRTYDFYLRYDSKTNSLAGGLGFKFERSTSWKFFGHRYRRHPKFSIRLDFYMDFDKPSDGSLTLTGSISVSGGKGSVSCTISGSGDDSCSLYVRISVLGTHTYRGTW